MRWPDSKVPGPHWAQAGVPWAVVTEPLAQAEQLDAPWAGCSVPAGQGVQSWSPEREKAPAGQGEHRK